MTNHTAAYHQQRSSIPTWDETFMDMARVIAKRSKDPSTQVGAVIVSKDRRILSVGYNGATNGLHDDFMPWGCEPLMPKFLSGSHVGLTL